MVQSCTIQRLIFKPDNQKFVNQFFSRFSQFKPIVLTSFPHYNRAVSQDAIGDKEYLIILHLIYPKLSTSCEYQDIAFQFPQPSRKEIRQRVMVQRPHNNLANLVLIVLHTDPLLIEGLDIQVSFNVHELEAVEEENWKMVTLRFIDLEGKGGFDILLKLNERSMIIANCCNKVVPNPFPPFDPKQCPSLPLARQLKLKTIPNRQRTNLICYNQPGLTMQESQFEDSMKGATFSFILAKLYKTNQGNAYKALAQTVLKYNSLCRHSQVQLRYMNDGMREAVRQKCPLILSVSVKIVDEKQINDQL